MWRYQADLHTHTVASGHADNTISEMVEEAIKKGITLLGITEHCVVMPGTCSYEYFENISKEEHTYNGIDVLFGVELNILDYNGTVDMDEQLLRKMDLAIASIHAGIGYEVGNIEENTAAIIGAIRNPYINIIGHLDDKNIPVDYSRVMEEAIKNNTLLEFNNNSLVEGCWRQNPEENLKTILQICRENNYPICINSDAHCTDNLGRHKEALELIQDVGFPKELILNYNPEKLKIFLNRYKKC